MSAGAGARISSQQLAAVVAVFQIAGLVLIMPAAMVTAAGPDAWAAIPVAILGGAVPVALLLHLLARYHPGRTLSAMAGRSLGPWARRPADLVLSGFALFVASLSIRDVTDFTSVAMLPGTPRWAIGALFAAVAAYAALAGGEVIARLAVLAMIITAAVNMFIPASLAGEWELLRIRPILGGGPGPILSAAWPLLGWFGQYWVLVEYVGLLDRPERTFRALVWGSLLGGAVLVSITATTLLTFGADLAGRFTFPAYALIRQVSVAEFMERMEITFVVVWLMQMLITSAVLLWVAGAAGARALGVPQGSRMLVLMAVLGAVAVPLSEVWPSIIALTTFSSRVWTPLALPLEIGLPALLVVASSWRRRRGHAS